MKKKLNFTLVLFVLLSFAVFFVLYGCEAAGATAEDPTPPADTGTPPPAQIVGTAALAGESATFSFTRASAPRTASVRTTSPKALYDISGSIRYRGITFTATGTYESITFVFSVTSSTQTVSGQSVYFRIMGSYTAADGFSGTIERYTNGVKDLTGSVSGSAPTASAAAVNYLGTFSGGYGGTWNMTLKDGIITGTYANYDPDYGSGTFKGTYSGSTLTFTSLTNSAATVLSFAGGGTLTGTSMSGTWNTTLRTPEGDDSSGGIWSGAAATTQGDPHTPSSSDPLPYRFALVSQALMRALDSSGYDVETEGSYSNPEGSVRCVVTKDLETGENTVDLSVTPDYLDPVTGITIKEGSTATMVWDMVTFDSMIPIEANMTFSNSPITFLQMSIDLDHTEKSVAGTITIDGTPLTAGEIDSIESLFF